MREYSNNMTRARHLYGGSVTLLVMVFAGIFLTVLTALSGYVLSQNRAEDFERLKAVAFSIAEAGLEYYRWHLLHFPNDMQNGTGQAGPYEITIPDPEAGIAGTASLSITANTSCGQTTSVSISSTGTPTEDTTVHKTITARYARPSVAMYSYIVNDSVWAGADRIINGPYHSNGGVRMDGTANAPVTSSLSSWTCTSSFGCTPSATKPGVFGAGGNQNLWKYPTPQMDFAGIAANFSSLKSTAQSSGLYFARYSSGNSNSSSYYKGYRLVFNANGTVTVTRAVSVTAPLRVIPLNSSDGTSDYSLINNENSPATYALPSGCSLIFVEDNAWIEGIVSAKVTLVVANVANSGVAPNAFLKNNISYATNDGSDGLTLIAERNILITPDSPQNMSVNGIFVAQGGAFGRNLYGTYNNSGRRTGCDSRYEPRGTLTILGSTISNKRTGTRWMNGCASGDAGYQTRIDSFDRTLANDPPPFTPITSTDYKFVDWREQ